MALFSFSDEIKSSHVAQDIVFARIFAAHMMLAGANRVQNERMMNMCSQNSCSNVTALVVSVIAGIGLAVIFSLGIIANVTVALWIAFGLSIVSLLALFALAPFSGSDELPTLQRCFCTYSRGLIAGTIGTLVTTLAALSLTIAVTSTALIIIFFLECVVNKIRLHVVMH